MSFPFIISHDDDYWIINCEVDSITLDDLVKDSTMQFMALCYQFGCFTAIADGGRYITEDRKVYVKKRLENDPKYRISSNETEYGLTLEQIKTLIVDQIKTGGLIKIRDPRKVGTGMAEVEEYLLRTSFPFIVNYKDDYWIINCKTDNITVNDLIADPTMQFLALCKEVEHDCQTSKNMLPITQQHRRSLKAAIKDLLIHQYDEDTELGLNGMRIKDIAKKQIYRMGTINVQRPSGQTGRASGKVNIEDRAIIQMGL